MLTQADTHKQKFYIFDFCGNFEFFRMNKGRATANMIALQGAIFHLKSQIAFKLQDLTYQTPELIEFRASLVEDMVRKVRELNRENFAVKQHLKYVELYSDAGNYKALTYARALPFQSIPRPCGNLKFTSASCFATIFPYFRADHS